MSEGNPGALVVIMQMLKKTSEAVHRNLEAVLLLDALGIYGSDIYVLYNDICDRDLAKTLAVIQSTQLGLFNKDTLKDACSRQDYSGKKLIPVEELYNKVKEKIPTWVLQLWNTNSL